MASLHVHDHISAHGQADPYGLTVSRTPQQGRVGIGHQVECVRVCAVCGDAAAVCDGGNRTVPCPRHVRRPQGEGVQPLRVRTLDDLARASVPHMVVDREGMHQNHRRRRAVAIHRVVEREWMMMFGNGSLHTGSSGGLRGFGCFGCRCCAGCRSCAACRSCDCCASRSSRASCRDCPDFTGNIAMPSITLFCHCCPSFLPSS